MYALVFVYLGIISFVTNFLQFSFFTRIGEGLTKRIRIDIYKKILRMPVSWFDEPNNNPGTLVTRLASDA